MTNPFAPGTAPDLAAIVELFQTHNALFARVEFRTGEVKERMVGESKGDGSWTSTRTVRERIGEMILSSL